MLYPTIDSKKMNQINFFNLIIYFPSFILGYNNKRRHSNDGGRNNRNRDNTEKVTLK